MTRLAFTLAGLMVPAIAFAAEGHGHGPPWQEIGIHAINFTLLVGLLAFLLRTPISDALKNRTAVIRDELEESNRLRKEALNRFEDLESRLARFENQVEEMRAEGLVEAEREAQTIAEKTTRDVEHIRATTEKTIRDETRNARLALRRESVELAVRLAEENLRQQLTAADQDRLSQEFLGAITTEGSSNG
ncbi:MAG: hypothetical protein H6739_36265 [Alphaproteobacteria bacterium]|nr:hypothetical protein [Alphaproteobacteria bacterium]